MDLDKTVRELLSRLKEYVDSGEDGGIYGDKSQALKDIESLLNSPSTEGVKYLLAPTANLQELSIENGWGQEFNILATKLEDLLDI